ncbi:MAG: hypothetical protein VB122_01935, partial [Erysipelotrichales bacterium]|nr:hypothetical protein [Erysipelotrichales bacterium]
IILKIIRNIKNGKEKFLKIKNDEKKYQKTMSYGIKSILFSLLAILSCVIGILATQFVMDNFDVSFLSIFLIIPWVLAMTLAYLGPVLFLTLSMINSIRQIKLKRRILGIISLILAIASIIGIAIFYYLIYFR